MSEYERMQTLLLNLCLERSEVQVIKSRYEKKIIELDHEIIALKWELAKMYSNGERY